MTGIGSYFYIVWAVWLRHCLNERQDEYVLNWPSIWQLPEVVLMNDTRNGSVEKKMSNGNGNGKAKTNGHTNGHAKSAEDRKSM